MLANQLALTERVCRVVARTFRVDPATVDAATSGQQVGAWDSLGHLRLMMEVEREFQVRFATGQIGQPRTVAEIAALVAEVKTHG